MIHSMTGFGKAVTELPNKKVSVEIRSLNSKQLDINTRVPHIYREKEIEIRNLISAQVERGKLDVLIYVEHGDKTTSSRINQGAIESYYEQIKTAAENLQVAVPSDWFSVILRLPETIKTEAVELDENEWLTVKQTIEEALDAFASFRQQEGAMLADVLSANVETIAQLLKDVEPYETERVEKVKARILEAMKKLEVAYDANRFEQEMIYYIERLDVNEEKTRLQNHLKYFLETLDGPKGQGKKLGFIAQEMGREINTLGSKANHADMQKIVVQMKDALEQIKEQVLNVL